jgi:flagellar biosynthetic protein FliQ
MPVDQAVELGRVTLQEVVLLAVPILGITVAISLLVNVVQVLTSLQEITVSTVPRLLAAGLSAFFLMPWMWRHLVQFTLRLFSDFHPYLR